MKSTKVEWWIMALFCAIIIIAEIAYLKVIVKQDWSDIVTVQLPLIIVLLVIGNSLGVLIRKSSHSSSDYIKKSTLNSDDAPEKKHKEIYKSDQSSPVHAKLTSFEQNKLTHELGSLLYILGNDILNKKTEIELDKSITDLSFKNMDELIDLNVRLLAYKVDSFRIARLCINLYNLLSGKDYLIIPGDKADKQISKE